MINQKSIHVKLDNDIAVMLEQEAFVLDRAKNRIINEAILEYCRMKDCRRRFFMTGHGELFEELLRDITPKSVHLLPERKKL